MNKKLIIGHLCAFGAYFIFGFNIVLTKDLTNSNVLSPMALFTLRALGAGLLFWLISLFSKKEKVEKKDLLKILHASLLGYYGTQLTFLIGIKYTSPMDCSIIATFAPVFTMLVAYFALKEPITAKKLGGVLISLCGIILLIVSSTMLQNKEGNTTPLGIFLILLNSLFFASYLGIFKPIIQKYHVITFMKWIFLFSFLLAIPVSCKELIEVDYSEIGTEYYLELGYLILFATFIAYFLMPVGQKNLRPTLVSLYSYLQPVVASVLGIYMGMDQLTIEKVLALALVVFGVILVNKSKARKN